MGFIVRYRFLSARWFKAYLLILAGALLIASGYVFFITPYRIVPGGIYGISIVLHHSFGTPVGLMALVFNIPLTLLGIRVLGPRFGAKTITGFILTSGFIDGLTYFFGEEPLVHNDPLLASIYGGAIIGLGVGFLFKAKATCGGTDVMAMMLGKWTKWPLGQLMMMVDSVIVVFGSLVFGDWTTPMYSLIAIFLMGKVIDLVLQGISYEKVALVISDKYEDIGRRIINDLTRGATVIQGNGMYNGSDRNMIFVVLNRRELAILEAFVHHIDPQAFMVIMNADEILGQGFRSLHEKLTDD
ncbi:MAG: YitT family protein [Bacteroidales bacterium]|nr:YitT family protein [Bacteroidales bacterium]